MDQEELAPELGGDPGQFIGAIRHAMAWRIAFTQPTDPAQRARYDATFADIRLEEDGPHGLELAQQAVAILPKLTVLRRGR